MKTPQIPKNYKTIVLIGLICLAVFFGKVHFEQWEKRKQINNEIEALLSQERQLQQKNKDLSESLSYLTTSDYKEKIAKEQLHLKKDGELVYNFTEPQPTNNQNNQVTNSSSASSKAEKWWLYFFKP
jgi:cell division protein FtsB